MFVILYFFAGLAVGSFLNVLIFRLQTKKTIFFDRSRCLECGKKLQILDLIPLVSFLFLAGRCRFCLQPISWQYPLVELATGLLFVVVGLFFPSPFDIAFWSFFVASFAVIIVYDFTLQLIPDAILWPFFIGVIAYRLFPFIRAILINDDTVAAWQSLESYIITGIITGGFILFLVFITQERAMGMGDVPLASAQGLLLGFPLGLVALGTSFILGAVIGIAMLLFGRATMKTALPFTPFLIIGLLIVLLLSMVNLESGIMNQEFLIPYS